MAKKYSSTIFLVFLFVIIATKCFLFRFGNLDEIWHYNLCRGITSGAVPYRDINLIGMPLYYLICSLPLFILKRFIVYRIVEALLIFSCALLSFFIVKAESGFGYAVVSSLITVVFIDITSYNNLLFLFTLFIYLANKQESSFKRNIMLGVLAALSVWSRQTSGFIVFIAETIYLVVEKRKGKSDIKSLISFFCGFASINFVFLFYLLATSSFYAFWDYCFFGLFSYSNTLEHCDIWGIPMVTIVISLLFAEGFLLKKTFLNTLSHILLTLALLTVVIPTVDMTHAIFAFAMSVFPLMAIIKQNIRNSLKPVIGCGTVAVLLITIARTLIPLFIGIKFDSQCSELDYIPMSGDESGFLSLNEKNHEYTEQGYKVIVLSSCSAIISIYDGSFNPPYDLFLVGSFGTQDPVDIVRDECSKNNTVIVISYDYNEENWMNPHGVYEYVVGNCTQVDSLGRFIYYVPNK